MERKQFARRNKYGLVTTIGATLLTVTFAPAVIHEASPFTKSNVTCDEFLPVPQSDSFAYLTAAARHWYDRRPDTAALQRAEAVVRNGGCTYNHRSVQGVSSIDCYFAPGQPYNADSLTTRRLILCDVQLTPDNPILGEPPCPTDLSISQASPECKPFDLKAA